MEDVHFSNLTLLHGCFSRFLNCTNATKSRNASHVYITLTYDYIPMDANNDLKTEKQS